MSSGLSSLGGEPGVRECSRAGCRAEARFALSWRNPRIHSDDRVKVWVACDEHVSYLREFLASRDFPVEVSGVEEARAR